MSSSSAQITSVKHRFIPVNGIKMHIAEQGEGPLIVLVHGWPELWYSWRHVLPALAAAGYHAVAPDMRGYGQTDAPPNIQDYTQFQFVGDVVGLVHTLGYEQAVIAGHDLGAMVAQNAAVLRPDMFRAVILLSVPYGARTEGAIRPTEAMRRRAPEGQQFYQTYFPDARNGREGVRCRSEAHAAHVPALAFWVNSEGVQMALHIQPKREGAGRLRGSETAPALAEAGGSGLLRQRILADRASRWTELVSRAGHFLARDAVSDRAQAAAADPVCRGNSLVLPYELVPQFILKIARHRTSFLEIQLLPLGRLCCCCHNSLFRMARFLPAARFPICSAYIDR